MGAQSKMSLTEKDKEAIRSLVEEMSDSLAGQGMTEDFAKWQAYYSVGSSLLPPVSMTELYFFLEREEEQVKEKTVYRGRGETFIVEPFDVEDIPGGTGGSSDPPVWEWLWELILKDLGPRLGAARILCDSKHAMKIAQSAAQVCNVTKKGRRSNTLPKDRRARTKSEPVDRANPEGKWYLHVWVKLVS